MKILYVGGFILPDKNAAAQRVVANAKALRELGHDVFFINAVKENIGEQWIDYFGFSCFEYKRKSEIKYLTSIKRIKKIIINKEIETVIAYNYPAVALGKMIRFCKKRKIKCIADVTEWYVAQGNIIFRAIKNFDTNLRMKKLHFQMDGIIAISEFLYDFYKDRVKTVKIPPLVDIDEPKWHVNGDKDAEKLTLVYAGSPSAQKERLNIIVQTIEKVAEDLPILLNVIGITNAQFNHIYKTRYSGEYAKFFGRVSNAEVIALIKQADWTVVLRDKNKVVEAGFPTKVVESITCGTPVIANQFSNIADYLNENNSILIESTDDLGEAIAQAIHKKVLFDNTCFDYRKYLSELQSLFF